MHEMLMVLIIIHSFVQTKNGGVRARESLSSVLGKTQSPLGALRKNSNFNLLS